MLLCHRALLKNSFFTNSTFLGFRNALKMKIQFIKCENFDPQIFRFVFLTLCRVVALIDNYFWSLIEV